MCVCVLHIENDLHLVPEDIEYGLSAHVSFCFAENNRVLEKEDMTTVTPERNFSPGCLLPYNEGTLEWKTPKRS